MLCRTILPESVERFQDVWIRVRVPTIPEVFSRNVQEKSVRENTATCSTAICSLIFEPVPALMSRRVHLQSLAGSEGSENAYTIMSPRPDISGESFNVQAPVKHK